MNSNLVVLFSSVLLGAFGQVLLKMGVNRLGQVDLSWPVLIHTIFNIFTNLWIVTGIFCFVTSMVLWIKVISNMELSKAYPSVSLSYIIVFIISIFLFDETASADKIVGLILVSMGVYFLQA
ncbi:MAG: EamA family transporter [Syntrophomonas sp.]